MAKYKFKIKGQVDMNTKLILMAGEFFDRVSLIHVPIEIYD
jgi:hypothetical protein